LAVFVHSWRVILYRISLSVIVLCSSLFLAPKVASAEEVSRVVEKKIETLASHWQLAQWKDGETVCNIYTRDETQPSNESIYEDCGGEAYLKWLKTPPCYSSSGRECSGLLVRYIGQEVHSFTDIVVLPKMSLQVEPVNCSPGDWCMSEPEVNIIGQEPLEGYKITTVSVRVGDYLQVCQESSCPLKLPVTSEQGYWLEYWANSNYGDESDHEYIKFRNYKVDPGTNSYRVDIISDEFADQLPSGSLLWNLFPSLEQPLPESLDMPLSAGYLATTNRYLFLAGNLIKGGYVDAKSCPWGGLTETGSANPCGEKAAAEMVLEWQNKYDEPIYTAAQNHNVPARVVKGIIAQESQFWQVSSSPYELGLGKITDNGVDLLLLWDPEYYLSVCTPLYQKDRCSKGYSNLLLDEKTVLRRTLLDKVGTGEEIDLLAAILYASAAQTNQLVVNTTMRSVSEVASYEDMWKITIGNYYSGSGCLATAMKKAAKKNIPEKWTISWDEITDQLTGDCLLAKDYVEKVFELSQ
jgi:hypothetical protein